MGAIRYISPLTGGLPHQSADWFAMTGYFEAKPFKHQFITQAPGEFFLKKTGKFFLKKTGKYA